MPEQATEPVLTEPQTRTLLLAEEGHDIDEIAEYLEVSKPSVYAYLSALRQKGLVGGVKAGRVAVLAHGERRTPPPKTKQSKSYKTIEDRIQAELEKVTAKLNGMDEEKRTLMQRQQQLEQALAAFGD